MLKPCPFCGGEAERREWDESRPREPYGLIVNHTPGCFMSLSANADDSAFDAAWNTRHDDPLVEVLVAALRDIAEATSAEDDAGENYRWDDREGALDYAYAVAKRGLAQWEKRNG